MNYKHRSIYRDAWLRLDLLLFYITVLCNGRYTKMRSALLMLIPFVQGEKKSCVRSLIEDRVIAPYSIDRIPVHKNKDELLYQAILSFQILDVIDQHRSMELR